MTGIFLSCVNLKVSQKSKQISKAPTEKQLFTGYYQILSKYCSFTLSLSVLIYLWHLSLPELAYSFACVWSVKSWSWSWSVKSWWKLHASWGFICFLHFQEYLCPKRVPSQGMWSKIFVEWMNGWQNMDVSQELTLNNSMKYETVVSVADGRSQTLFWAVRAISFGS